MDAQLALPFEEDRNNCTIYLNLSREDIEYLVEDRRRLLEDKYFSHKDEDTTLTLLDAIIAEAGKEIP